MYAHTSYFLKLSVHVKFFFFFLILKSIFVLKLNSQLATLQIILDKKRKLVTRKKYHGMQTINY